MKTYTKEEARSIIQNRTYQIRNDCNNLELLNFLFNFRGKKCDFDILPNYFINNYIYIYFKSDYSLNFRKYVKPTLGIINLSQITDREEVKMRITKEQILKLTDISDPVRLEELKVMFPEAFEIEFDPLKIYVLKKEHFYRLIHIDNDNYAFMPIQNTRRIIKSGLPFEYIIKHEKDNLIVFETFKEYVNFLNTLV